MMYFKEKLIIFCLFFSVNNVNSMAQEPRKVPPETPKLVVQIVVGQMRYDFLNRYWTSFGEDGFKKLINEGTSFTNARYNYLLTQSAPGYATIATGANPSAHGIIGQDWYVRLTDEVMEAVGDDEVNTIGGSYKEGKYSPKNLIATTIADEMKLGHRFKSKVIGVGLDPHAAILSSGNAADAAYWYDNENGNWITSSYYLDSLPEWVEQFNKKKLADTYLSREWKNSWPLIDYLASINDTNDYEIGFDGKSVFPYDIEELSRTGRKKIDYRLLKQIPFGNSYTKDFAIEAIIKENLGEDKFPDFLSVNFSAMEYINNNFGITSVEMQDAYLRLDKEIAHLLSFLHEELGKENVLVLLTSDHGVAHVPQYLEDNNIPAGYFNFNKAISLLISYLKIIYGNGNWIQTYNNHQLYLDHDLILNSKLSIKEVQDVCAGFLLQFSGVYKVMTAENLLNTNYSSGMYSKMQNSFNQKRSGDVIISLEPGWIEKGKYVTRHNSSYAYDAHVPLVWYGWQVKRGKVHELVDITSIAPTLAILLKTSFPNTSTSKPLLQLLDH